MKTSKDYSIFKFKQNNRPIHQSRVSELVESIKKIGYRESRPISVNKRFEILDGQHRFHACKLLGLPILYVVENGAPDNAIIQQLNNIQAVWRLGDYIHHFAQNGVAFHKEVERFDAEYKLGVSNSIEFCAKLMGGGNLSSDIRKGVNLSINPKREKCVQFLFECSDLPFYRSTKFVRAIKTAVLVLNDDDLAKLKKHILTVPQCATYNQYLAVFENIVNKYRRGGNDVRLVK